MSNWIAESTVRTGEAAQRFSLERDPDEHRQYRCVQYAANNEVVTSSEVFNRPAGRAQIHFEGFVNNLTKGVIETGVQRTYGAGATVTRVREFYGEYRGKWDWHKVELTAEKNPTPGKAGNIAALNQLARFLNGCRHTVCMVSVEVISSRPYAHRDEMLCGGTLHRNCDFCILELVSLLGNNVYFGLTGNEGFWLPPNGIAVPHIEEYVLFQSGEARYHQIPQGAWLFRGSNLDPRDVYRFVGVTKSGLIYNHYPETANCHFNATLEAYGLAVQEEEEALRKRIKAERLEREAEQKRRDEARAAREARDAEPEEFTVGEVFFVHINQGKREATALAVLGDEVLAEYTMPKGTSALFITKNLSTRKEKRGGRSGGVLSTPTARWKSVSYRSLNRKWLAAAASQSGYWEGRPQKGHELPHSIQEYIDIKTGK